MGFLSILALIASIYAIWHVWKKSPCDKALKVVFTVLLLFISYVGLIAYGVYYLMNKDKFAEYEASLPSQAPSESSSSSPSGQYGYSNAVADYEEAERTLQGEELENRYGYLFVNFMLNMNMSIDEKCRLIELNEEKINNFTNDPVKRAYFYITRIRVCYQLIGKMLGDSSVLVQDKIDELSNVEDLNLRPMVEYLGNIMSLIGCFSSPDGEFSLNYSVFDKYKIPNFVEA